MSNLKYSVFLILALAVVFTSCNQPDANSTGSEFMPDMAHSVAYEANIYNPYSFNTWDEEDGSVKGLKELSMPGMPVEGTIPRGYSGSTGKYLDGTATTNAIAIPANGAVPYYYGDNEDERARAMNTIINNPFPITEAGLATGKELYDIQCGICHGKKGDGNGWLVDEANANAKYPAAPANFLQDTFLNSSNGRFYHAIIYGKNVMGGYTDKLSYEERWQVIHYIHSLQAKSKKLEYNNLVNTFTSNTADRPGGKVKPVAEMINSHSHDDGSEHHGSGEGHEQGNDHGHDAGHEGHDSDHGHEGDHNGHDGDHGHGENHDGNDGDHGHNGDH